MARGDPTIFGHGIDAGQEVYPVPICCGLDSTPRRQSNPTCGKKARRAPWGASTSTTFLKLLPGHTTVKPAEELRPGEAASRADRTTMSVSDNIRGQRTVKLHYTQTSCHPGRS